MENFFEVIKRKAYERFGVPATGSPTRDSTLERLSRETGIPRPTLSRMINEHNLPSIDTLAKLVRSPAVGPEVLEALGFFREPVDEEDRKRRRMVIKVLEDYQRGKISAATIQGLMDIENATDKEPAKAYATIK